MSEYIIIIKGKGSGSPVYATHTGTEEECIKFGRAYQKEYERRIGIIDDDIVQENSELFLARYYYPFYAIIAPVGIRVFETHNPPMLDYYSEIEIGYIDRFVMLRGGSGQYICISFYKNSAIVSYLRDGERLRVSAHTALDVIDSLVNLNGAVVMQDSQVKFC